MSKEWPKPERKKNRKALKALAKSLRRLVEAREEKP